MVQRPAITASAGPVIKVTALLFLCRGPESDRRHMVLQTIALPTELPRRDLHSIGDAPRQSRIKESNGLEDGVREVPDGLRLLSTRSPKRLFRIAVSSPETMVRPTPCAPLRLHLRLGGHGPPDHCSARDLHDLDRMSVTQGSATSARTLHALVGDAAIQERE